jgi:hypothetical protein
MLVFGVVIFIIKFISRSFPRGCKLPRISPNLPRRRIHECTISLRFLGIILRVLILEVSVLNVYITNQFQTTFAQGGGGVKSVYVELNANSKREYFCPNYVREFGLCRQTRKGGKS